MSRLIRNASDEVKAWATIKLGIEFCEPCWTIGITNRHGKLIGAAIFNNYQQCDVCVTVVGRGAFRKDVLRELARCAYHELERERVSITVHPRNELVLGLAIKMGFRVEGRKPRFYPDGADAILLGLLKHQCNFLED